MGGRNICKLRIWSNWAPLTQMIWSGKAGKVNAVNEHFGCRKYWYKVQGFGLVLLVLVNVVNEHFGWQKYWGKCCWWTHTKNGCRKYWQRCKNLIIWSNCSSLGGFCSGVILLKEMPFLRQRRSDRWFRMWIWHPPQEEEKLTHYIFIQKNFWSIWVVLNVSFNHRLSTLKVDTQIYSQVFISRIRLIK